MYLKMGKFQPAMLVYWRVHSLKLTWPQKFEPKRDHDSSSDLFPQQFQRTTVFGCRLTGGFSISNSGARGFYKPTNFYISAISIWIHMLDFFKPPFGRILFFCICSKHQTSKSKALKTKDKMGWYLRFFCPEFHSAISFIGQFIPSWLHVPWSRVAILGMVIPPLIGILIMGI